MYEAAGNRDGETGPPVSRVAVLLTDSVDNAPIPLVPLLNQTRACRPED